MFLRLCLLGVALTSSFISNLSFKSSAPQDIVIGAIALLIAILCMFFLLKGLWRMMGCMTTFILVAILVAGAFYFASSSGIMNSMGQAFKGEKKQPQAPPVTPTPQTQQAPQAVPQNAVPAGQPQQPPQPQQPVQPQQPPVLVGKIDSIISGDLFRMQGQKIRLYGIATPLIDQNCSDSSGTSFQCGYTSAQMLKKFVMGDDVTCRIMNYNAQKELLGACSVSGIDIGAAMVEAGWAIALPNITQIYLPYQKKAEESRQGLWAGTFQMPWVWAVQRQEEKAAASKINYQDYMPKKSMDSIFDAL